MKLGQLIESNKRNNFLQAGTLVPDLFSFFRKPLYKVRTSGLKLGIQYISIALKLTYNKSKLH